MKKAVLCMLIVLLCMGLLASGMQTVTGYYADPAGYGFHHLEAAYFYISLAMTLLGGMAMVLLIRRL